MQLPEDIIKRIKDRSGLDFNKPKAFYALSCEIEAQTTEVLSQNTLRRLLGYLSDGHQPHRHTLDVVAVYLGFNDWSDLIRVADPSNSVFSLDYDCTLSKNLEEGQRIVLTWNPDRRVTLRHEHENTFTVISNEHSKLRVGDILQVGGFASGYPFIARSVVRNGEECGCYTAASKMGITSIKFI